MEKVSVSFSMPIRHRPTIRDIARDAGVSIATVSRVLNGRPDVSPGTRDVVLRVARDLQFSTNRSARGLQTGRTGLVAMTIPIVHSAHFAFILSGASEALHEQDMRIVLCPTRHEHDREVNLLERVVHGTTDGAILVLPEESGDELRALQAFGYPFVVVDPRAETPEGVPAVTAANTAGAVQAVDHLLGLGHTRIGAITGLEGWTATEDRRTGYRAALGAAGIRPDPALEVAGDWLIDGGVGAAEQLLERDDPPTAIFAFNDNLAVGALQAVRARGLRVPDDVSVVGFDDAELAAVVTPGLTTVRQPLAEMGRMAVSLLTRLLEGQRVDALKVELATKLLVRGSTAPPRGR